MKDLGFIEKKEINGVGFNEKKSDLKFRVLSNVNICVSSCRYLYTVCV